MRLRIVGGKYRGRRIDAAPGTWLRPTSNRSRETMFNILAHARFAGPDILRDADVLDAFAGTGALGFEALSRGARSATFIDSDPRALKLVRRNAETLGEDQRISWLLADTTQPPRALLPCRVVFLDPPYQEANLAEAALLALNLAGWIADDAVIVLERDERDGFTAPPEFRVLAERRSGRTMLTFLTLANGPRGAPEPEKAEAEKPTKPRRPSRPGTAGSARPRPKAKASRPRAKAKAARAGAKAKSRRPGGKAKPTPRTVRAPRPRRRAKAQTARRKRTSPRRR
ncbi:MAG: 16S rRNA (guanine(966)-N(2))-methyltransferase RsmD [Proteobacteria bacterium]|nr:16S rRNA (guanine(966)-N(2))-methyltransferase RsmD [Pseudomonadota bacterium]